MTTSTFSEKFAITSAMATAFLSAHMSVRAGEHLCEHALSGDHDDEPDLWHNLARAEVHEAEREIENFVRASTASGLDVPRIIGTFAADLDGLERRLDAIRYLLQTDLADRFWWGSALFEESERIVTIRREPVQEQPRRLTLKVTKPDPCPTYERDPNPETTLDRLKRSLEMLKGRVDLDWDEWGLFSSPNTEALDRAEADLNESATRALQQDDPRDAWAIFRAAGARHYELGASDSEAEWVFHRLAMERYGEAGHRFGPDWETN